MWIRTVLFANRPFLAAFYLGSSLVFFLSLLYHSTRNSFYSIFMNRHKIRIPSAILFICYISFFYRIFHYIFYHELIQIAILQYVEAFNWKAAGGDMLPNWKIPAKLWKPASKSLMENFEMSWKIFRCDEDIRYVVCSP